MKNITNRTNFLREVRVKDNIEYDMSSFDFKDFDFGPLNYYRVTRQDLCRPDIISQKIYGTMNYYWFLMRFNGITDIWNDLRENLILKYPSIEYVQEAFRLYKKG